MLWYKKMLKGELIMLEEVVYKEDKVIRSPTNRDTLRNSNNQMPDQSSVETFAADVQKKTKGTPRNPCLFCRSQHFNDECE